MHFRAPAETLQGERVHQWIGARMRVDGPSADFDRIGRQQVLVRCLFDDDFEFGRALEHAQWVSTSDAAAYDELRLARASWRFATFSDVIPRRVAGKAVLIDRRHVPRTCRYRVAAVRVVRVGVCAPAVRQARELVAPAEPRARAREHHEWQRAQVPESQTVAVRPHVGGDANESRGGTAEQHVADDAPIRDGSACARVSSKRMRAMPLPRTK